MIHRKTALGRRSVLALGGALLAGRAYAAPLPITDALGRAVALRAPAERIVLLFNYEEFTAVAGAPGWDRVVGFAKAQWATYRAAVFKRYAVPIPRLRDLPDVGNTEDGTFSMERVLALRPDLVIMPEWSFGVLGQQVRQLEALGVPVLVIDYNAQAPERHVAGTVAMGVAVGQEERARALAALYVAKLADIARRVQDAPAKPKAYLELGMAGPGVVGNTFWKSMWGRLLDRAGADNIAAGCIAGGYGPMNPEYVLAADPDAIFIAGSSFLNQPASVVTGFDADLATTRARLAPYTERQGWAGLKAVRTGQVFAVEHGLARSLFDYTATYFLAKSILPDRFADIDPVEELRRYHEQYLPVAFEGTWMARLTPTPA